MKSQMLDVVVIGGGPAGISACLELSRNPKLKIALFESEAELGGIPRSCHLFFGMRDMSWLYSGPGYAKRLRTLLERTPVHVHAGATVLGIATDPDADFHVVRVSSSEGMSAHRCRFVVLATGCFERSREARRIPGSRPAGVFTTGSLQQIVNLRREVVGRRAVIVGSEHVAFSAAMTLRHARSSVVGLIEEEGAPSTYGFPAKALSRVLGFPIYLDTEVTRILGEKRVEAVELRDRKTDKVSQLECDSVICTGKFRPDAALVHKTAIAEDASSLGPVIDSAYITTVKNIFAAGNILHGAEMNDICALEGRYAARGILRAIEGKIAGRTKTVTLRPERPIRFAVPQRISMDAAQHKVGCPLGIVIQVEKTLVKPAVEVWSGDEMVWSRGYRRLVGNSRVELPAAKFNWSRVDPERDVVVRIRASQGARTN